ncbi:MAG: DUF1489 domain-containing protein [Sphingomonadales bacterium]|jgi:hypothetical protein|nr:DUF1489 domain-containing protein [Sphingomonadales bacterium]MBK9004773.1 DUF1489 domain-containing protein [Sphingomonadales bacterium]MBK9267500.1 DUF1489 domain-containing protein [Sphingomonadales bacterium]MBP6433215.1 DUF1489 domain-containing protein [Sphingorhabdus sp.]
MPLHMTKIAFGAESPAHLRQRLEAYAEAGEIRLTTRYLPKRHEEMVGGSLYWIVNHMLVGRSEILGFMDNGQGKTWIRLRPELIAVRSIPKRAHQGWRYLDGKDAPPDLGSADADGRDEMPSKMLGELMKMGLV